MDRPYIICHILSALDGKIAGTFAGTKAAQAACEEYARIRSVYQAAAWLYGTTTIKEFTQNRKTVLEQAFEDISDGDYIAETELRFYYISLDTAGENWSNMLQKTFDSLKNVPISASRQIDCLSISCGQSASP